jgi:hypothetical protein
MPVQAQTDAVGLYRSGQPAFGPEALLITRTTILTSPVASPANSAALPVPPNQVEVGQAILVHDPATPDIAMWFPVGAIQEPAEAITYRSPLPPGVNPMASPFDSPFFFGAWILGQGRTIDHFEPSILISVPYHDRPDRTQPEEQLRMMLYDPFLQGWTRLCGAIDPHLDVVHGLITTPTPIKSDENTLLGLGFINSPSLAQSVNEFGVTTLTPDRDDFRLSVLPNTISEGTYFEITSLPHNPRRISFQLVGEPVDIKACAVDHTNLQNSTQLTQFPKPFRLEFRYTTETADRAGGAANLTIVSLQNEKWVDVEDFGLWPRRDGNTISLDVYYLGTFSLAVR